MLCVYVQIQKHITETRMIDFVYKNTNLPVNYNLKTPSYDITTKLFKKYPVISLLSLEHSYRHVLSLKINKFNGVTQKQ